MSDPLPSDGESLVERAMRLSLSEKPKGSSASFTDDDHLAIIRSGAADLSSQERFALFEHLNERSDSFTPKPSDSSRTVPLFFGSWSGMNPFRFLKPFRVKRSKDAR